ncbi:N-acetyltransferase NAT13 [Phlebopus sp. FC_14]|nr:N-acetyltransferase NAT13 [Phlebopus sp. FC_14]
MEKASPARVSFASFTKQNLGTVRKLNAVLFPVTYSQAYYNDILRPDLDAFCQLVYYNDIPVGNFSCRLEESGLYIMTLGILAPYRSMTLGSQALQRIISTASGKERAIKRIYLHVHLSNQDAKRFYERHGFEEKGVEENYYKKIDPHAAWILEKRLEDPTDE